MDVKILESLDLSEATFTREEATGRMSAKIDILRVGRSKNPRVYRESAVRGAAEDHIFDGARMFVNHSETPPLKRSLTEMVAAVESTQYNPDRQMLEGTAVFFDPAFFDYAQRAKPYMGTSIRALCRGERVREASGQVIEDIHEIVQGHSVDWVIYPAAGGAIQSFAQEAEGDETVDWSKITLEELRTNAPELVQQIESALKQNTTNASPTSEEISALVKAAIDERDQKAAEAAKAQAEAQAKVTEAVGKSGLPEVVRKRLITQLVGKTDGEVAEAIKDAADEIKALGAGPRITGQGNSQEGTQSSASHPTGISVAESVEGYFGMAKKSDKKSDKDDKK
jgi:hypothetical protein